MNFLFNLFGSNDSGATNNRLDRGEDSPHFINNDNAPQDDTYDDPEASSFRNKNKDDYIQEMEWIRDAEFPQLNNIVYLDHAGSTLFPNSMYEKLFRHLQTNMYSNPHSLNAISKRTTSAIEEVRNRVLDFFHTSSTKYHVVFTMNASHGLKILGEAFPFTKGSKYVYLLDSVHNSVLGVREYALERGGSFGFVTEKEIQSILRERRTAEDAPTTTTTTTTATTGDGAETEVQHLFAFPAECNFSGSKYDLSWIDAVQQGKVFTTDKGRWRVVLDASKYAATNDLDLSAVSPDFVVVSFYKIFGYPSGLGALLVRKDSASILKKRYFGGGTVAAAAADDHFHAKKDNFSAQFEDGTLPFLSIISLRFAFDIIRTSNTNINPSKTSRDSVRTIEDVPLTMDRISRHTRALSMYLYERLTRLRHYNGSKVCVCYHSNRDMLTTREGESSEVETLSSGSVLALNFLQSDGEFVGYSEVERLCALNNIQVRTGCFCNAGACQKHLDISAEKVKKNYFEEGHVCWDDKDLVNGSPTGCVRVSFSYMSTFQDAKAFAQFVEKFFVERTKPVAPPSQLSTASTLGTVIDRARLKDYKTVSLKKIFVYPVKSCRGFEVDHGWPLCETGLLYDREWAIVNDEGVALNQKRVPRLSLISPSIDLKANKLVLSAIPSAVLDRNNKEMILRISVSVDLNSFPSTAEHNRIMRVCGQKTEGLVYASEEISSWLEAVLGVKCCYLARKNPHVKRYMRERAATAATPQQEHSAKEAHKSSSIAFSNEAQFLMVSMASLRDLNERLARSSAEEQKQKQKQKQDCEWLIERFRPNLVIDDSNNNIASAGLSPYEEDNFSTVVVLSPSPASTITTTTTTTTTTSTTADDDDIAVVLKVAGQCNRCSMICIDQNTCEQVSEPLKTLSEYRRTINNKIVFGILLSQQDSIINTCSSSSRSLRVGDVMYVSTTN